MKLFALYISFILTGCISQGGTYYNGKIKGGYYKVKGVKDGREYLIYADIGGVESGLVIRFRKSGSMYVLDMKEGTIIGIIIKEI